MTYLQKHLSSTFGKLDSYPGLMFEVPTISDIHHSVEAPEGRDYTWGRLGHMVGWTRRILLREEVWRPGWEGFLLGM